MSLQPNISKFPKHLQHVRLQKEEEEEQWISGEELCTDGSSDEDNTNDVKKKFKSKLQQPSKESLLAKKPSSVRSNLSTSTESDKNSDVTENLEISPTHWRPKRGSIKLPKIDDKSLDLETEKWKTEDNYKEIIQEFESYKYKLKNDKNFDNENLEKTNDENNNVCEVDVVFSLDNELEKMDGIYDECKKERLDLQKEVCEKIKSMSYTVLECKSTKKFHEICHYKNDSHKKENRIKQRIQPKFKPLEAKSISRKKRNMADIIYSEKDKERLQLLLSDIDIAEKDDVKEDINDVNEDKEQGMDVKENKDISYYDTEEVDGDVQDIPKKNAFRMTREERHNLDKIENKLKTLQEMCDDADLKGKLSEFSIIDEENREWKAYLKLTEERFHRINEKINKLHELDELQRPKEEDTTETVQET